MGPGSASLDGTAGPAAVVPTRLPVPAARCFLCSDLRKNHGKEEARARDLFYALWIPDEFMRRVEVSEKQKLSAAGLQPVISCVAPAAAVSALLRCCTLPLPALRVPAGGLPPALPPSHRPRSRLSDAPHPQANADWSLFCPSEAPGLADCWGEEFEALYAKYAGNERMLWGGVV